MKKFLVISFSLILSVIGLAQTNSIPDTQNKKMDWWREARFGMFIHWGVYAVPADNYHGFQQKKGGAEWIMNRMKIPVSEYQGYAKEFNPVKFNAETRDSVAFNGVVFKNKNPEGTARPVHDFAVSILDSKLMYPSIVFLDEHIQRIQVLQGYLKPDQFEPIMKYFGSSGYKNQKYEDFQKTFVPEIKLSDNH